MANKKYPKIIESMKESFSHLEEVFPFLKKKVPLYDDGKDEDSIDLDDERGKFIYAIFSIYGILAGIVACHYCKFLHQLINCSLWGIELTKKTVPLFSVIGFLSDAITFAFVYIFSFVLGAVLWGLVNMVYKNKKLENSEQYCSIGLMLGLLFMVIVTVITAFIPFSIFLIGV